MKVIIATQAYNVEDYLAETIESVLNQTYTDFTYLLIDSASTDSTSQIMQEYAQKDSRIKYIHFDVNALGRCEQCAVKEEGDYYMALDSDDLLELDCLEKMVSIAEESKADIIVTGMRLFNDLDGSVIIEKRESEPFTFREFHYAELYSKYHTYFRNIAGKLYKLDVVKKIDVEKIVKSPLVYGKDTWFAFQALRKVKTVYVDNSCFYKYRIRPTSVSNKYTAKHFEGIIWLYNDAIDFLSQYGEISTENIDFINNIFMEECIVFLKVLNNANLPAAEKLSELLRFVSNDIIKNLFNKCVGKFIWAKSMIRTMIIDNISDIKQENENVLIDLFNEFLNDCKDVFEFNMIPLFINEPLILQAFVSDDKNKLFKLCFELIEATDRYKKEYNLGRLIWKLIPGNTPVSAVKESEIFELYPNVCQLVLSNKNAEALSLMTEIMLSGEEVNCAEDFLNVYIKLAALENYVEAFLFGNIQKAYFFIDENRKDEAKRIVDDLVEMGAGASEDVVALKELLN